jgi:hypothetical protein
MRSFTGRSALGADALARAERGVAHHIRHGGALHVTKDAGLLAGRRPAEAGGRVSEGRSCDREAGQPSISDTLG